MKNHIPIKRKLIIVVVHLYLLFPLVVWGGEDEAVYLCIAEESTGFYFENGKWGATMFNVGEEKFIIRKFTSEEISLYFKSREYPYGVFKLGEKHSTGASCRDPKESLKTLRPGVEPDPINSSFVCRSAVSTIFFYPESGRFIKIYNRGYWDGVDNNNNTPEITRGRCSKT